MKIRNLVLPGIALGGAAFLLLTPGQEASAFTTIGGAIPIHLRDFRVFNNFADAASNDNTTIHPNWPGYDGAELAHWKAFVEWGSEAHGDGTGDPNQSVVGSGGSNFDVSWQGNANGVGGTNDNIVSAINSCSSGVLAFTETPISDGWRIRFCESWTWSDGPGNASGGQINMQGVSTHEFGHALGLGHTNINGSTMFPSTFNGNESKSIEADDIAGVKFLYGNRGSQKVDITSASYDSRANTVTLTGNNFSTSRNDVWFTNKNVTSTGADPRVVVSDVRAVGGVITVSVPSDAGPGDVHVRSYDTAGSEPLSSGHPINLPGGPGSPRLAITSIVPATVEVLEPGTAQSVTINGTLFTPSTQVSYNSVLVDPSRYTVVNDNTITVDLPQANLGTRTIAVIDGLDSDDATIDVVAPIVPRLEIGSGDPLNPISVNGPPIPIVLGDIVGRNQFVFVSLSNVPSVAAGLVSMDIGNNFSDLTLVFNVRIPAGGWTSSTLPINPSVPTGLTIYFQTVVLGSGRPFPVSSPFNPQSIVTVP